MELFLVKQIRESDKRPLIDAKTPTINDLKMFITIYNLGTGTHIGLISSLYISCGRKLG